MSVEKCRPFQGNTAGSVFEDLSIEAQTPTAFDAVAFAHPRMPIGETWGTFGAVAVVTGQISQSEADTVAQETADYSASHPLDAIPPKL